MIDMDAKHEYFKRTLTRIMRAIIDLYFKTGVGETENTFVSTNGRETLEFKLTTRFIEIIDQDEIVKEYTENMKIQKLMNPDHNITMVKPNKD